ncbi:MAG: LOG family protein [Acidobacteria bacterium]|nr:LOG family protein [Acidobacteriota bacterium]
MGRPADGDDELEPSADRLPAVAVFGSSEPQPGDDAYELARRAGELLARSGWAVLNGGYGGVMEAASRGAREAGGHALGVTVASFSGRSQANRWLSTVIQEQDLFTRTRALVDGASGYLVLPGKAGTLAELSILWALRRARLLGDRPTVLCGQVWPALLQTLTGAGILDPDTLGGTWHATHVEDAVGLLLEKLT